VGYLILGVLVLFLAYLALWLVVAGFMLVGLPVVLAVLPAAAVGGVVLAVVVALRTLAGAHRVRPRTVTPNDVVAGTAGLPKLRGNQPFGRDPAWPSYLVAQWRVDLSTARRAVTDLLANGFRRIARYTADPTVRVVRVICGIVAFGCWLDVSAGALLAIWALLLLCGVIRTVVWLGWLVVLGTLRGGDFLVRRIRRAQASCQYCYHVSSVPAFPCDRCGRVHHDIRPGRLGGAWRRCACGRRLPTTVLRASAHGLPATCQRCDKPLRTGSAVLTDIRVPVFGPVFAGKTRLVYAGLLALRDASAALGVRMDFVDDESRQAVDSGSQIITSGADTVKTPAGVLPSALTLRFTVGRRRALLHLFDAAGEFYADREDNGDLEFLDHAKGLVFVVDPFSVPWVRDQLGDTHGAELAKASQAAENPETVYQVTTRRLRDFGVDTRRRALAMTVVKADLLAGLPPAESLHPDQVRAWLVQAGLDNLVLSAERDFGQVRYFLVASVPANLAGADRSPAAPFNWLIARAGLNLLPAAGGQPQPLSTEGAL
jgi:hypothetical protein